MKIVHICPQYTDGWSYQENCLSKYHADLGNDVTVISSTFAYDSNRKLNICMKSNYYDGQVEIIRLKDSFGRKYNNKFRNLRGLKKQLETQHPDVIFLHGVQFVYSIEIYKYTKKHPAVKLYVDNHADFSNSAASPVSKYILHGVIWRHIAHKIDPYVTKWYGVLPARVDFLRNVYGLSESKTELLVMGADDEKVKEALSFEKRAAIRSQYEVSENDILVMTGGKIDSAKKQTLILMEEINRLSNQHVKLIVFGSVTPDLKDSVESFCTDKVKYIGWVQPGDTYAMFAAADLVVFPGRHSVFWEQVAGLGVPMICKYWEGTDHVDLGGNVRFLYRDSSDEIKELLDELTCVPDKLAEMKKIAKQKGMKMFSYRDIAQRSI